MSKSNILHNAAKSAGSLDFKLSAVQAVLNEQLLECNSTEGAYYTIPVNRIKNAAAAEGSAVHGLVRKVGSGVAVDASEKTWEGTPFIDLVGAGIQTLGGGHVPYVALITNTPGLVKRTLDSSAITGKSIGLGGERMKLFRQIREKLLDLVPLWKDRASAKGETGVLPFLEFSGECVVIVQGGERELLKSTGLVIPILVDHFFEAAFARLLELREGYGEGWLPGLARFAMAINSTAKSSSGSSVSIKPEGEGAMGSGLKAAIATNEFLGFGWLTKSENEKVAHSGIQVFKTKFLDTWPDGLPIRDKSQMCQLRSSSFESGFKSDRAVVALKFYEYSNGSAPECVPGLDRSKFFILPTFSATAVSALMRLLPRVSFEFIAFQGGSSRTTDAGVLERIFELGLSRRGRKHLTLLNEVLCSQVPHLLEDGHLCFGKGLTSLEVCNALDEATIKGQSSLQKPFNLKVPEVPSSQEVSILRRYLPVVLRLFSDSRGAGEGGRRRVIKSVLHRFLGFSSTKASEFSDAIPTVHHSGVYNTLRNYLFPVVDLWRMVRESGKKDGSRVPPHQLIEWLGNVCVAILRGLLIIPEEFQEWMNRHARFVVILPADSPTPQRLPAPRAFVTKPQPGSRYSCQYYSRFFGEEKAEASLLVDLDPLLNSARLSMVPGSKNQASGWLASKCSETNQLVVCLMRAIGYVGNFDLERLPLELEKLSNRQLLDSLDSRLIIRAIKSTEQGCDQLNEWTKSLVERVQRAIYAEIVVAREITKESGIIDSYPLRLLELFFDQEGIAAAAMDAARSFENRREWGGLCQVYFRVDALAANFHPRNSLQTGKPDLNSNDGKREQAIFSSKHRAEGSVIAGNTSKGEIGVPDVNHEDKIWRALSHPDVSVEKVAEDFRNEWQENEHYGDTPEDFLKEYATKLEGVNDESRLFLRERLQELESTLRRSGFMG
jgi:hypothetical protein